jgi:hypothetical protein
MGGADIPSDRPVDGVDQAAFLLGKQEHSAREWFPAYVGTELYAMKWRNWKIHLIWQERIDDPQQKLAFPRLFNLYVTPQERPDESLHTVFRHGWVARAMFKSLAPFQESLKKYPPIPPGTADPYVMQVQ